MRTRLDELRLDRATVWMFYYLGIVDGISSALESFKGLNPDRLKDAEWRVKLRNYLPPELAPLGQPHSDIEPAVRIIEIEALRGLRKRRIRARSIN